MESNTLTINDKTYHLIFIKLKKKQRTEKKQVSLLSSQLGVKIQAPAFFC
jgi:hypothetical protein